MILFFSKFEKGSYAEVLRTVTVGEIKENLTAVENRIGYLSNKGITEGPETTNLISMAQLCKAEITRRDNLKKLIK